MPVTDKLLVIVPTRGRPRNAERLEARCKVLDPDPRTHFMFVVDHDDPEARTYLSGNLDWVVSMHPRLRLGPTLNAMAMRHLESYAYVGFMGDDHLPQTEGWDTRILAELDKGGPQVVYGNDLLQGRNLPTAVFMPTRAVKAMGFMCPPDQVHLYLDNFWLALGQTLGTLTYLDDVVIEHVHPIGRNAEGQPKAQWDDRYAEVNAASMDIADRGAWQRFHADGRFEEAVRRVQREYGS